MREKNEYRNHRRFEAFKVFQFIQDIGKSIMKFTLNIERMMDKENKKREKVKNILDFVIFCRFVYFLITLLLGHMHLIIF